MCIQRSIYDFVSTLFFISIMFLSILRPRHLLSNLPLLLQWESLNRLLHVDCRYSNFVQNDKCLNFIGEILELPNNQTSWLLTYCSFWDFIVWRFKAIVNLFSCEKVILFLHKNKNTHHIISCKKLNSF